MDDFTASMALITYKGKLLLVLRDEDEIKNPNTWHLIGGQREVGETPEETIKREIWEEIGIKPAHIEHLFLREDKPIHVFHVGLTDKEAKNVVLGNEGQELRYFSKEELTPNLKTTGTIGRIIREKRDLLDKLLE